MSLNFGILTISDRSSQGIRPDTSGPVLVEKILSQKWIISQKKVVPDDFDDIRDTLISWCEISPVDIILTTGGTGFSPRDITPEATLSVAERIAPGIAEAMRARSMVITPHAMLSRSVAVIRKNTLIINLPGSPKAAIENLDVVLPVLPHAIELLINDPVAEKGHLIEKL